jgi:hypothetical protein
MYYTLLVTVNVLLSNPPAPPVPGGQVRQAAPLPQAPEASKIATARKRLKKVLQVNARTLDAAAHYLALAESVKQAPTDEALCLLVSSANSLQAALGDQLSPVRDRLYSLPSPAPGQPDPLDDFSKRVDRADKLLPGIGLGVGAETLYHSTRHGELAQLAQQGSAARRLLESVASIWQESIGWPVYIEQQTDVTGCWRPGALLDPLRAISSAWGEAPACLRQALAPTLQRALLEAVDSSCFCEDEAETRKQLQQLAAEYQKLPLPDAKAASAKALETLKAPELRFNCQ